MSSIIKVNTVQDTDGNNIINENANTITIGKSGDTVQVASGASLVGAGIEWQSSIVTASTITVVANRGYWLDTSSNAITVTLPAAAAVGDRLIFTDYARKWGTNAVTINPNSLNFQGNSSPNPVYNTTGQSVDIVYSGATKGWIPNSDDDITLETPQTYSTDFLVIAGGGAGGSESNSGGGGAGGYRTSTQSITPGNVITVTVGSGGAVTSARGNNGSNSSISGSGLTTITSAGGGAGGAADTGVRDGVNGGSGGGSANSDGSDSGGSGNTPSTSPSQGNNGGGGAGGPAYGAGGGGGASAVGQDGTTSKGGNGGDGSSSSITGSAVTRAGGGGGASDSTIGTGGAGGGGNGASGGSGIAGTANTGGGGGGGESAPQTGGAGGSGVVILSMPDANYSGTVTGSPTVATGVSGKTVLTFTGTGSYTA